MSSEVPDGFVETNLQAYCSRVADGTHTTPVQTTEGKKLATSKNIKDGRLTLENAYLISVSEFDEINKRSKVDQWDILISMIGTVGEVCLIDSPKPDFAIKNVGLLKCGNESRAKWLYFFLRSPLAKALIEARKKGTTQQYLSLGEIRRFPVFYPADDQCMHFVTDALSALDDRIALLRETSATLEAIAQALFKSWFVDFDPVHAKQQGLAPEGMDEATASLFPDGFEESALGAVPRGWRVMSVGDMAEVVKGKSYSSKDLVDSHDTALVTLKSFERGGGFRLDGFKPYSGTYKPSQVVVPGDLIIAYTDVTQAAELIGKPAIVVGVENHQTLVASLDVGIVRPNEAQVSRQFLYGLFRTEPFQNHTFAHTSGTTVLHLAKDGVVSFPFACPPAELVKAFTEVAEALAGRRQTNIDQMRTLATLRDTLLPRLISGQLRLPEAAAVIAEKL